MLESAHAGDASVIPAAASTGTTAARLKFMALLARRLIVTSTVGDVTGDVLPVARRAGFITE